MANKNCYFCFKYDHNAFIFVQINLPILRVFSEMALVIGLDFIEIYLLKTPLN